MMKESIVQFQKQQAEYSRILEFYCSNLSDFVG